MLALLRSAISENEKSVISFESHRLRQAQGRGQAGEAPDVSPDGDALKKEMAIDEKAYVDREKKFFEEVGLEGDALGTASYLHKKGEN